MIICDTGPIFAAADRKDVDHHACVELSSTGLRLAGRRLLLPQTVLAEVGQLLEAEVGAFAEVAFLESVADGSFELVDLTRSDAARIAKLVARYDDLPLGTTDASVIALAERLGVADIATLDHRHFRVVRPRHVDVSRSWPQPHPPEAVSPGPLSRLSAAMAARVEPPRMTWVESDYAAELHVS